MTVELDPQRIAEVVQTIGAIASIYLVWKLWHKETFGAKDKE